MRRRRIRTRRPTTRRSDWVVGGVTACDPVTQIIDTIEDCGQGAGQPLDLALLDPADIEEHTDHVLLLRIVGDICRAGAYNTPLAPIQVDEGIIVQDTDASGSIMDISATSGIDADAAWLWRRSRLIMPIGRDTAAGSGGVWWWEDNHHLDIRVKRKLTGREQLVYTSNMHWMAAAASATGAATLGASIRVLVRSKG